MKVTLSRDADQDIDEIYLWIAKENLATADQLLDDIIEFCFLLLPENPKMGPVYRNSLRVFIKRGYRIIYQIADGEIQIVRILHPARNDRNIIP